MKGGPWTRSMKVVHGPGPKWGSMDPWSVFCPHPTNCQLSKLVNDKFQTEYSGDKRKEILQKYKTPSNCTQLFAPKVNPEIWGNLSRYQNVCVTGHVNQSVQCHCGNGRGPAESSGEKDLS